MKKYIAEFTGTLMLTLIACGIAITTLNHLVIALAFGLVVIACAYSIGNVSGAHVNPAVSLGFALTGQMKWSEFGKYVCAQTLGAIAGSGILSIITESTESLGANTYSGSVWIALLVEVILTFIFVLTILGVTDKKENTHVTGIVIGLTLTLVHLFGIHYTGTSVNPARSIGPALFQGADALSQVWVFILAPIIGAALAACFFKYILKNNTSYLNIQK